MFELLGITPQALVSQLLIGLINGSFYALLSLGLAASNNSPPDGSSLQHSPLSLQAPFKLQPKPCSRGRCRLTCSRSAPQHASSLGTVQRTALFVWLAPERGCRSGGLNGGDDAHVRHGQLQAE